MAEPEEFPAPPDAGPEAVDETEAPDRIEQAERIDQAERIEVPHTGDLAVDEALTRVVEASRLPLEEQVVAFDAVHRILQDRLADVDG